MKFCLEFHSILIDLNVTTLVLIGQVLEPEKQDRSESLNNTSSSALGFHCKFVDLVEIYNFAMEPLAFRPSLVYILPYRTLTL